MKTSPNNFLILSYYATRVKAFDEISHTKVTQGFLNILVSLRGISEAAIQYRRFPVYQTWGTLCDIPSIQLPPSPHPNDPISILDCSGTFYIPVRVRSRMGNGRILYSIPGPFIFMQFLSSPVSTVFFVLEKQRILVTFQTGMLILTACALWLAMIWVAPTFPSFFGVLSASSSTYPTSH
jgi:hypothetical protein